MLTALLSSDLGYDLDTLSLWRLQLEPGAIWTHTLAPGTEWCVYRMTGALDTKIRPDICCSLRGRRSVRQGKPAVLRIDSGATPLVVDISVANNPDTLPVDCLIAALEYQPHPQAKHKVSYHDGACCHHVGEGVYQRTVWEVPQPHPWQISCGETFNPPGHWSSWPAHANPQDEERLHNKAVTWQECFFVVTPGYGLMRLDGYYHDGTPVHDIRRVDNGEALVTPLGAHPIVAAPDAWLWYAWFYCGNALQKTYNRWATDVRTYVK